LNDSLSQYDTWNFNQSEYSINWVTEQGYGAGGGSGMDYSNLALTNQSNVFTTNQTFNTGLNVSDIFYVDSANNRIGIGTSTPTNNLEIGFNTTMTKANSIINTGDKTSLTIRTESEGIEITRVDSPHDKGVFTLRNFDTNVASFVI